MSWAEEHAESEQAAAGAEMAAREGDLASARRLFARAAEAETRALDSLDQSKPRTLGVTAVSAVALCFKAEDYATAQRLAYHWLGSGQLPTFAVEELQLLLQTIWSEQVRQRTGLRFSRGEVLVSIKGGRVVTGGAPLDLILRKIETVQALFYRTTEYLKRMPHRRHGPATIEIQETCRPWLFQAAPGSYQFAVAIEEPAQGDLFSTSTPRTEDIAATFMSILRATVDDPDGALLAIVQDSDYRGTFLKLTRNLAPAGDSFAQLEVRLTRESRPVTLLPTSRQAIGQTIQRQFPKPRPADAAEEVTLRGVLRALHLDRDWLEVTVGDQSVHIDDVGETVDDVVGPMVNRRVIVDALRKPNGRYSLRDIQLVE